MIKRGLAKYCQIFGLAVISFDSKKKLQTCPKYVCTSYFLHPDIAQRLGALKSKNPDLKVLFSLGGWGEGSEVFSHVASDPEKRTVLVDDILDYLQKFDYDGLDFDWEYPAKRNGTPADKVSTYRVNMLL